MMPLAATYGAAGAGAVIFTRYDGGVAFLWIATAVLIAVLMRTPTKRWHWPLAVCGAVSALNTGLFGLGWAAALPLAIINLMEASLAVFLLRRWGQEDQPLDSLGWFARYVVAVGLAAPLVASCLALILLAALGQAQPNTFFNFLTGHALGNLTFTPLALMLTGRKARRETLALLRNRRRDALILLPLVLAVVAAVFAQPGLPLLFLPVMAIILATFRMGRVGASLAIALLAFVGGVLTSMGFGPITLLGVDDVGSRLQFFQFYLATTVLTVLPVSADLRNRKRLLDLVRTSEERFRLMAEHCSDLMMHIADDGRILYVSPSMQRIGGHDPQSLIGRQAWALIAPENRKLAAAEHLALIKSPGTTRTFRYRGLLADGSKRWFETHARAICDHHGLAGGTLSFVRDITESKVREEQLSAAALTDILTGLPNRRALLAHAETRRSGLGRGDCAALLDIDHFKRVNDSYGHDAGDQVLKSFAQMMRGSLRPTDMPARLGGEEFVILFADTSPQLAMQICDRLREHVAATPIRTSRGPVRITVSGGVAPLTPAGMEEALRTADSALYKAKHCGRDQFRFAA